MRFMRTILIYCAALSLVPIAYGQRLNERGKFEMDSSLGALISAERERYANYFEASYKTLLSQNPKSARELLISVNAEQIPYPFRYVRTDVITLEADGSNRAFELYLDPSEEFENEQFSIGDAVVDVRPFTWCATQIAFNKNLTDSAKLDALLTKWFDVDDSWSAAAPDEANNVGFAAKAIHSSSLVETNGQLWFLTIDFGTAPADALIEVIELLVSEGSTEVIVFSHSD